LTSQNVAIFWQKSLSQIDTVCFSLYVSEMLVCVEFLNTVKWHFVFGSAQASLDMVRIY